MQEREYLTFLRNIETSDRYSSVKGEEFGSQFSDLMEHLSEQVIHYSNIAGQIIDNYYAWWSPKNKLVIEAKKSGEKVELGVVAPFIRKHTSNQKVYITWVKWPKAQKYIKQRGGSTFASPIKAHQNVYSYSRLQKHCKEWEIDVVWETERTLAPIRAKIDAIHNSLTIMRRVIRKYENTTQPIKES